jgi:hypothetical protein
MKKRIVIDDLELGDVYNILDLFTDYIYSMGLEKQNNLVVNCCELDRLAVDDWYESHINYMVKLKNKVRIEEC